MLTRTLSLFTLFFITCALPVSCGPVVTPTPLPALPTDTTTLTPLSPPAPTQTPFPAHTASPTRLTHTASLTRTPTATSTLSPTPLYLRQAGMDGDWLRYINTLYSFAFSTPPDWTVYEWGDHFLQIYPAGDPTVKLTVGTRFLSDDIRITRTGVPEGDLVTSGGVPFFGEDISKDVLIFEGRIKAVLYNYATEVTVGERAFTLSLGYSGSDYESLNLPAEIIATADRIVASFSPP